MYLRRDVAVEVRVDSARLKTEDRLRILRLLRQASWRGPSLGLRMSSSLRAADFSRVPPTRLNWPSPRVYQSDMCDQLLRRRPNKTAGDGTGSQLETKLFQLGLDNTVSSSLPGPRTIRDSFLMSTQSL
ncbi:hypothetical protein THAOC_00708 [Thalassiosira oceanica]|uniref:Uncharacterized protein n=1 Tax=Thalassiosira oceanica TaxID=159749 RepID=K0TF92_THAOC|nr:hypothetical protein THAOC_00708 [Thalassiosira oceanica]|eukprot:EJK77463.1 hypothetical protein THAOC_00708 [Thalassiosira oceanica]